MNFSDYFHVSPHTLETYGSFNISLISDLPLFIDPFLLFNSKNSEYRELHNEMIEYLKFLRDKSAKKELNDGLINAWYRFKEVKQNWFGYSAKGNAGNGLGRKFALALNKNLNNLFKDFGDEGKNSESHLEKLCLIDEGVGKDHISDFTTNLIKEYLLEYTQEFAKKHINKKYRQVKRVEKVRFNYDTETWEPKLYDLPFYCGDYVLLTPRDLLSKDEQWINKNDVINELHDIITSIPNEVQRAQLNNYFRKVIIDHVGESKSERDEAKRRFILKHPEIINYYIRYKELNGDKATTKSNLKVVYAEDVMIEKVNSFRKLLNKNTNFIELEKNYKLKKIDAYQETKKRIEYFKHVIEDKDGYKMFYHKGVPIKSEKDVQLMFKLVWYNTLYDVNSEVNDGRGPVDFSISKGIKDKVLAEFKLASNTQLKKNLNKQVEIYKKAHDTDKAFKVIIYFDKSEYENVIVILKSLKLDRDKNIILIDASPKQSASKVK